MKENIILISKDILKSDYLSCYGGIKWKTPNIDKLALSGTIFNNFYTVAPSSAMAYTCMFSGLKPFEINRSSFTEVNPFNQCPTLFELLASQGYSNHVIWDKRWYDNAWRFSKVYGNDANYHNLKIEQPVGPHYFEGEKIIPQKNKNSIDDIMKEIMIILKTSSFPIFIWLHCPHVFAGRTGYGSDIDLFDDLVGRLSDIFLRNGIFLTGDHGHMDCVKGIPVYGFHLYEQAIKIPLITPNFFNKKEIDDIISNIQLKNIILEHKYDYEEYIYSDTQYYLQKDRRLMIRKGDYKYIFSKRTRTEELYDLKYDPAENMNLLINKIYDMNREKYYFLDEIYYYPRWEEAKNMYFEFKNEKKRIWREGTKSQKIIRKMNDIRKKGITNISKHFVRQKKIYGNWNSIPLFARYER